MATATLMCLGNSILEAVHSLLYPERHPLGDILTWSWQLRGGESRHTSRHLHSVTVTTDGNLAFQPVRESGLISREIFIQRNSLYTDLEKQYSTNHMYVPPKHTHLNLTGFLLASGILVSHMVVP